METKKILEILAKELKMHGKDSGKNYFFKCPFHEDKSPSFALKKEDGLLKCFSCDFKTKNFLEKVNPENYKRLTINFQ